MLSFRSNSLVFFGINKVFDVFILSIMWKSTGDLERDFIFGIRKIIVYPFRLFFTLPHCISYTQVVVLIGSFASAVDISRDIAGVAKDVHIASRSVTDGTI